MQFLRSPITRLAVVWLLLPGYLFLLSADRRADGSFACWLDLTLTSHLGESNAPNVADLIKSTNSVAEALRSASDFAASDRNSSGDEQADSNTLFTLLIGEWKQFRQVNASTTPSEQPELRDQKLNQRTNSITATAAIPSQGTVYAWHNSITRTSETVQSLIVCYDLEPMESGLAIGAP